MRTSSSDKLQARISRADWRAFVSSSQQATTTARLVARLMRAGERRVAVSRRVS